MDQETPYTVGEVAKLTGFPPQTCGTWLIGQDGLYNPVQVCRVSLGFIRQLGIGCAFVIPSRRLLAQRA